MTSISWSMRASCGVSGFVCVRNQECVRPVERHTFCIIVGSGGTPLCSPSSMASYWKSERRLVMSVLKSTGAVITLMPTFARSALMKFIMAMRVVLLLFVFSENVTGLPRASSMMPSPLLSFQPMPASSFFASAGL